MTTVTSEYTRLEGQLRKVRRAWKRTAALSGLAAVLLESIGILTLVVLLSWFYGHIAAVRIGVFAAGGLALAGLIVKHIVLPLARRIPDEQIALYVEEHNDRFEGALITAAEFGGKSGFNPTQKRMIEAIVHVADVRAERGRISRVVSLSRLRKYGLAALISLGVYIVICAMFPNHVGRRIMLALQPWRDDAQQRLLGPDGRPLPSGLTPAEARRLMPIAFKLSQGNVRLARGADLRLEAQLSREPSTPVLLHFRPIVEVGEPAAWQELPMDPIERLNTFARTLQSVSESMEVRVSAEQYSSDACRITVYDKIELQGVETVTHFPDYLKFPDKVERLTNGDVSAPVGSKVTVRIVVNTELVSGKLVWVGGQDQPLTVDPQRRNTAYTAFDVTGNRQYSFEVTDIDAQVARSLGSSEIFALPDNPPTIELREPIDKIETHPLGEVTVVARATDDFGVASVELIYMRAFEDEFTEAGMELPLTRRPDGDLPLPEVVDVVHRLLLEEIKPAPRPGEIISWYLQARDRKPDNPPAATDIQMIVVLPFEMWGAYALEPYEAPEPVGEIAPPLAEFLQRTWELHRQKFALKADEYNKSCEAIAADMISPTTGVLFDFAKLKHPTPRQVVGAARVNKYAKRGHESLLAHDTLDAVKWLRLGVSELVAMGIVDTENMMKQGPAPEDAAAIGGGGKPPEETRLMEMFAQIKLELERKLGAKLEGSLGRAEKAAAAGKAVEGIRGEQQGIVAAAKDVGKSDAAPAQKAQQLGKLAQGERTLAGRARTVAGELKRDAAAGAFDSAAGKIDQASQAMLAAAGHMDKGEVNQAVTKASEADKLLGAAKDELIESRFRELQAALAEAESMAEAMLQDQAELRRQTEAVQAEVKRAPEAQPDPKQKRELKKVSFRQVELKARFDTFSGKMDTLQGWADAARSDTAKHVDEAYRTMKRSQPGQKMANAVVELSDFKGETAAGEQRKAEQGLAGILTELQAAGDTLAAGREEGLKRALREAKAIEKGVAQLAKVDGEGGQGKGGQEGKSGTQGGQSGTQGGQSGTQGGQSGTQGGQSGTQGGQSGTQGGQSGTQGGQSGTQGGQSGTQGGQSGTQGGQSGTQGGQSGTQGGQTGGQGGQSGAQAGQTSGQGGQSGDQSGQAGGEGEQAGGESEQAGQGDGAGAGRRMSPRERREAGREIASDLRRLGRQLDARDFGVGADADSVKRVAEDRGLEAKLVSDPVAQSQLLKLIARVSDKLEAELESTAKAKRLLSARREECPPSYRHLVNKYYETLSRKQK